MKDFIGEKQRERDCGQQISDRIKKRAEKPVSCTFSGFYLFGFFPHMAKVDVVSLYASESTWFSQLYIEMLIQNK